jgi:hypothetical protein
VVTRTRGTATHPEDDDYNAEKCRSGRTTDPYPYTGAINGSMGLFTGTHTSIAGNHVITAFYSGETLQIQAHGINGEYHFIVFSPDGGINRAQRETVYAYVLMVPEFTATKKDNCRICMFAEDLWKDWTFRATCEPKSGTSFATAFELPLHKAG